MDNREAGLIMQYGSDKSLWPKNVEEEIQEYKEYQEDKQVMVLPREGEIRIPLSMLQGIVQTNGVTYSGSVGPTPQMEKDALSALTGLFGEEKARGLLPSLLNTISNITQSVQSIEAQNIVRKHQGLDPLPIESIHGKIQIT